MPDTTQTPKTWGEWPHRTKADCSCRPYGPMDGCKVHDLSLRPETDPFEWMYWLCRQCGGELTPGGTGRPWHCKEVKVGEEWDFHHHMDNSVRWGNKPDGWAMRLLEARTALESTIAAQDARIAELVAKAEFIVNILGPVVPEGLPDGADIEWSEALAMAEEMVGLAAAAETEEEVT